MLFKESCRFAHLAVVFTATSTMSCCLTNRLRDNGPFVFCLKNGKS